MIRMETNLSTIPEVLIRQGVSRADMAWWESLGEEGREKVINATQAWNMAMFKQLLDQGAGSDALKEMYKQVLVYAFYPLREDSMREWQEMGFSSEDYPLPWQLHDRCDKFIWLCFNRGKKEWFQEAASKHSTMNAFFRGLIREGAV